MKIKNLASVQAGPFGTQLHKDEYVAKGIPMLNAKNVGNGVVDLTSVEYVSEAICRRLPRYVIKKGDILFGRAGSIERHTYIDDDYDGAFQGTNCIRIRCEDINVSKYLSYYLWLPQLKKNIENNAGGSTMSYLSTDLLNDININLPSKDVIIKVVDVLSVIDKKIRNNNKINDNLQQMAHTTYMHLFFGKKTNGKLEDILVENPKSAIQVGEAKDIDGEYPFFTSGDAVLRWCEPLVDGRNCFLNTGGNADVKFYVGKTAYSTDTWCISAKNDLSDYLYLLLKSIKPELNQKFFQGTGLKHLQKPLLKERPIYIPSEEEAKAFNNSVQPWFTMISDNIRESQRLTALRDFLLPMLMNGQATISE